MYLVISSSLNEESKSRILAKQAVEDLKAAQKAVEFVDLRDWHLPHCDGQGNAEAADRIAELKQKIEAAEGILLALPIYNFNVGSSTKGLIELTGAAWTGKVVSFLCAAGGGMSYMAVMSLANSLMLDFRCLILPRFVYAEGKAFDSNQIVDTGIRERVLGLTQDLQSISIKGS